MSTIAITRKLRQEWLKTFSNKRLRLQIHIAIPTSERMINERPTRPGDDLILMDPVATPAVLVKFNLNASWRVMRWKIV